MKKSMYTYRNVLSFLTNWCNILSVIRHFSGKENQRKTKLNLSRGHFLLSLCRDWCLLLGFFYAESFSPWDAATKKTNLSIYAVSKKLKASYINRNRTPIRDKQEKTLNDVGRADHLICSRLDHNSRPFPLAVEIVPDNSSTFRLHLTAFRRSFLKMIDLYII